MKALKALIALCASSGVVADEDDMEVLNEAFHLKKRKDEIKKTVAVKLFDDKKTKESVERQWKALGVAEWSALPLRWQMVQNLPPLQEALKIAKKFNLTPYLSPHDTALYVLDGDNAESAHLRYDDNGGRLGEDKTMTVYFHGMRDSDGEKDRYDINKKELKDVKKFSQLLNSAGVKCSKDDEWTLKVEGVAGSGRYRRKQKDYDDGFSEDSDDSDDEGNKLKRDQFAAGTEAYFTNTRAMLRMDPHHPGRSPVLVMPSAPYRASHRQFRYVCPDGWSANQKLSLADVKKYFALKGDGWSDHVGAGPTPWIAEKKMVPCGIPQQFLDSMAAYLVSLAQTINNEVSAGHHSEDQRKRIQQAQRQRNNMESWQLDFKNRADDFHNCISYDNRNWDSQNCERKFQDAMDLATELYPELAKLKNRGSMAEKQRTLDQIQERMAREIQHLEKQYESLSGTANLENLSLQWNYSDGKFTEIPNGIAPFRSALTGHDERFLLGVPHHEVLKIARGVSRTIMECGLTKFYEPFVIGLDSWVLYAYRKTSPAGISAVAPSVDQEVELPRHVIRQMARVLVKTRVTEDVVHQNPMMPVFTDVDMKRISQCKPADSVCKYDEENSWWGDECASHHLQDSAQNIRIFFQNRQNHDHGRVETSTDAVMHFAEQFVRTATAAHNAHQRYDQMKDERERAEDKINASNMRYRDKYGNYKNNHFKPSQLSERYPHLTDEKMKKYAAETDKKHKQCMTAYTKFYNQLQTLKTTGEAMKAMDNQIEHASVAEFEKALEPLKQQNYDGERISAQKLLHQLFAVIPEVRRDMFGLTDEWNPTNTVHHFLEQQLKPALQKFKLVLF